MEGSALVGSIQKFSVEDGPGIRTSVFFKGCPLNCRWCHNPELIDPKQQLIRSPNNCIGCGHCLEVCPKKAITMDPEEGILIDRDLCDVCLECARSCYAEALRPVAREMTIAEIVEEASLDREFYVQTGGGATLSGGEVLMKGEFLVSLVEALDEAGIGVCLDTCGFGEGGLLMEVARMEAVTDILYDVKSVDDGIHEEYTGVSNGLILENLRMLASDPETAKKLTIRMPLIGGVNDDMELIRRTGELYESLGIGRITLLPYHDLGVGKATRIGSSQDRMKPPGDEIIEEIKRFFEEKTGAEVDVLGLV